MTKKYTPKIHRIREYKPLGGRPKGQSANESSKDPYHSLWMAVLSQQIDDAGLNVHTDGGGDCKENKVLLKRSAVHWLTMERKEFYMVCDLAGLNADSVFHKIQRLLQQKGLI